MEKAEVKVVPARAGAAITEEMVRLERGHALGEASQEEITRLGELTGELSRAVEEATVVVVLQVATRRGGMRRTRLQAQIGAWLEEEGYSAKNLNEAPAEVMDAVTIMSQGAVIAGALVDSECENFEAPAEVAGWLEVPDQIFAPALQVALELNPHWAPAIEQDSESKN